MNLKKLAAEFRVKLGQEGITSVYSDKSFDLIVNAKKLLDSAKEEAAKGTLTQNKNLIQQLTQMFDNLQKLRDESKMVATKSEDWVKAYDAMLASLSRPKMT